MQKKVFSYLYNSRKRNMLLYQHYISKNIIEKRARVSHQSAVKSAITFRKVFAIQRYTFTPWLTQIFNIHTVGFCFHEMPQNRHAIVCSILRGISMVLTAAPTRWRNNWWFTLRILTSNLRLQLKAPPDSSYWPSSYVFKLLGFKYTIK